MKAEKTCVEMEAYFERCRQEYRQMTEKMTPVIACPVCQEAHELTLKTEVTRIDCVDGVFAGIHYYYRCEETDLEYQTTVATAATLASFCNNNLDI